MPYQGSMHTKGASLPYGLQKATTGVRNSTVTSGSPSLPKSSARCNWLLCTLMESLRHVLLENSMMPFSASTKGTSSIECELSG